MCTEISRNPISWSDPQLPHTVYSFWKLICRRLTYSCTFWIFPFLTPHSFHSCSFPILQKKNTSNLHLTLSWYIVSRDRLKYCHRDTLSSPSQETNPKTQFFSLRNELLVFFYVLQWCTKNFKCFLWLDKLLVN